MIAMLANHLWQSTLFVAVMGVLVLALRSNGAHVRYWIWMAASIKFILPFSMLVALGSQVGAQWEWRQAVLESPLVAVPQDWSAFAASVVQPIANYPGKPAIQTEVASFKSIINVEFIVECVWLLGFVAVLGFWLSRWLRMKMTLRLSKPLTHGDLAANFPVPIRCAPGAIEPGVVGIFRPILVVPDGLLERLTRAQIQAIFAHERCHLERRDNLTATIHMLVEAVFWFHPVVWWVGGRLIEEREAACDAAVLKAGNDPETYAAGILDVCQHYVAAPLDCVAGVSGADLKKRVRSIMLHRGEARMHVMKWLLIASVSSAVVVGPIVMGAVTSMKAEAIEVPQAQDDRNSWPMIASSSISLSQSTDDVNTSLTVSPNGTFATHNRTLRGVIAWAYGIQDSEVQELSASVTDLASSRYNMLAKAAFISVKETEAQKQLRLMARRLLEEQFKLRFHWEEHRVPVYVMSISAPNTGIKRAAPEDPGPFLQRSYSSVTGHAVPLLLFKQFLSHEFQRPIVDLTGLTDRYNFTVKWGSEPGDPGIPLNPETVPVPTSPTKQQLIEAVQNQLGLSLASQDGDVKRMIVDHLEQPSSLKANPVEVRISTDVFDRYVGYYEGPANMIMTISREGDKFLSQLTGQPPIQIYASSDRDFFTKLVEARGTFHSNDQGVVTDFVLFQNGREFRARRIDSAVAKARIEALKVRIRDRVAQPGTEAALRTYFDGLYKDAPAYEIMTKEVADAVRATWPPAKGRFARLGRLHSIEHKQVDAQGADIYLATFDNGALEYRVGLDAQGKIDLLNYRRLPQT